MTDLIKRLRQIAHNDWRVSILAHTSDTAASAADALAAAEKMRKALVPFAATADAHGGMGDYPMSIDYVLTAHCRRAREAIVAYDAAKEEP